MALTKDTRIVIFDDDGIAVVYASLEDLARHYEIPFLYEISQAFDADGYELELTSPQEGEVRAQRRDPHPDLSTMRRAVSNFTRRWIVEKLDTPEGSSEEIMDSVQFALTDCRLRSTPRSLG